MGKFIDLTEQVFGRLTVVERTENSKTGKTRWRCKCDCGNITTPYATDLRRQNTKSCGCLNKEATTKRNFIHGMSHSSEHNIWWAMVQRCYNPKDQAFSRYGGRGITICNEWRTDFMAFFNHIGPRPSKNYSIERVNNNKGYKPGNVKWGTRIEQSNNKRDNHPITFNGQTKNLTQWARSAGINKKTLFNRINTLNWPIEKALTQPVQSKRLKHPLER